MKCHFMKCHFPLGHFANLNSSLEATINLAVGKSGQVVYLSFISYRANSNYESLFRLRKY